VEAQTDIQTYLEQGKQALAQGQAREAAIAYAHGAQMEPENPMVHLGLAEANLALGNYGVVQMACRRAKELQPNGGLEGRIAQAILELLDRRYDRVLQHIDIVISEDPSIAYAHALRSYVLRVTGQDYDANLARARAARLSYGGRFENCFPAVEPLSKAGSKSTLPPVQQSANTDSANGQHNSTSAQTERRAEPKPAWSTPNQIQRQIIRTRFTLNQYPGLVTNIIIAINIIILALCYVSPKIIEFGAQINVAILQGQYWRLFTAMFINTNILSVALTTFSLFFMGRVVEMLYGQGRYVLLYVLSGLATSIVFLLLAPDGVTYGAYGAIFGIFGALGIFLILNRRTIGPGMLTNWIFWLGLNLVFGFAGGPAFWADLGGLAAGVILGFLFLPRSGSRVL
jgi:membrane associated rhomboid family serine protease